MGTAACDPERGLADVTALHAALEEAQAASALPWRPTAYDALHDLAVRTRAATGGASAR